MWVLIFANYLPIDCQLTLPQVAGLKEELKLEGNQYNVLLSMASTG
jgi:hypothetical protein